ncbi:MAG: type III pantothenate kinase [Chlorobi bacterium]|nr:type III pantothenate kinase [Chlorobiota bacterium]
MKTKKPSLMTDLCIDIGNTAAKAALYRDGRLQKVLYDTRPADWDLCAVDRMAFMRTGEHPAWEEVLTHWRRKPLVHISASLRLPFRNLYETPDTLGADRVALTAGAAKLYRGHRLVIDAGTCVTYDLLNRHDEYEGGIISPGLVSRYRAMHEHTAGLPLLAPNEQIPQVPGRNTAACMHAGATGGWLMEIEGYIRHFEERYPGLKVIVTGGDAPFLYKSIKNKIFAFQKFLAFEGMQYLLTLNT